MSQGRARSPLQPGHVESALVPDRAKQAPPVPAAPLLGQQASIGNQAVQRRIADVLQPKLNVNAPGDAYEQEADRMAEAVMRAPEKPGAPVGKVGSVLQRKGDGKKGDDKKKDDKKPAVQKKEGGKKDEEKKDDKKPKAQRKEEGGEKKKKDEKKPAVQKKDEGKKDDEKKPGGARKEDPKKKDDKKPAVQKKEDGRKDGAKKDDDKKKDKEGKPGVQKKEDAPEREEDDRRPDEDPPVVQAKPEAESPREVPAEAESIIRARQGRGEPLTPQQRARLEPRFGHDLSGVRLHTDSQSQKAAKQLNAQAFTVGRDVFFGPGRHQPGTEQGDRLLAHELTHTIQQAPGPAVAPAPRGPPGSAGPAASGAAPARAPSSAAAPAMAQRQGDSTAPPAGQQTQGAATAAPDPKQLPLATGRLTEDGTAVEFDSIRVPKFKAKQPRYTTAIGGNGLERPKAYNREDVETTAQSQVWRTALAAHQQASVNALKEIVRKDQQIDQVSETEPYLVVTKGGAHYFGNLPTIAREAFVPKWKIPGGQNQFYDVDHVMELQLGGENAHTNMELVEHRKNRSSGGVIGASIRSKAAAFVTAVKDPAVAKDVTDVKQKYALRFKAMEEVGDDLAADERYLFDDVKTARHITKQALSLRGLETLGGPGTVIVFSKPTGGFPKPMPVNGPIGQARDWIKPFQLSNPAWDIQPGNAQLATVQFAIPADHPKWEPASGSTTIQRMGDAERAGYLDTGPIYSKMRQLQKKGASPIVVDDVDIGPGGLTVRGRIVATLPIIQGTHIDFQMEGDDLTLSKTFDTGDFKSLPGPLRVTSSSLTILASTGTPGFRLEGAVAFAIPRVGQGSLVGGASTRGFDISGAFQFDPALFDPPAEIRMSYVGGQFALSGTLSIGPDRVRGIRRASATIGFRDGVFSATGTADLSVPGIDRADVRVGYSEATGLEIGGTATLAANIPAVESGTVDATVRRSPEGAWEASVTGNVRPKVPGVDTTLRFAYENGATTIEGSAQYQRGMLRGALTLGATNRGLDAQGRPTGAGGTGPLRAYGSGSMTVRLAPWLQGTVGVRITQQGELEVTGEVALPAALDLFEEKRYEKRLFSLGLDIPIVGVAVAGQRIGIFATVRGSLDLSASVGPGQLREASLSVQYNPQRESETLVRGRAQLHVPANAGLRLSVRGGLGAGIPIVSATAGLEIGGELGLDAALTAGVQVDWTPSRGLVIEATPEVYVQPKLRFDVSGFVDVSADLLLTTIELYHKRFQLAAFEFGSNLRFGMRLPIRYEEGRTFSLSWDQVQFTTPQIDTNEVLKSIVKRVV